MPNRLPLNTPVPWECGDSHTFAPAAGLDCVDPLRSRSPGHQPDSARSTCPDPRRTRTYRSLHVSSGLATLLLLGACGGEPAVFDAPDFGQAVNPGYQPCDNGQCPSGFLCQQQICIPMRDLGTTGEQTTDDSDAITTGDGGETTGTGGETTDGQQTTSGADLGETTDSGSSDNTTGGETGEETTGGSTAAQTTGDGDTTTGGESTGQVAGDDGEVLDECKIPGQAQDCDDPNKTGCRVIGPKKYACSGSLSYQPKGVGCSKHEDCDPLLGCHHSICTSYCEIAAGNAYCTFGSPWPECKSIDDPQWGACSP